MGVNGEVWIEHLRLQGLVLQIHGDVVVTECL